MMPRLAESSSSSEQEGEISDESSSEAPAMPKIGAKMAKTGKMKREMETEKDGKRARLCAMPNDQIVELCVRGGGVEYADEKRSMTIRRREVRSKVQIKVQF